MAWPMSRVSGSDLVLAVADDWSSTKVTITHWYIPHADPNAAVQFAPAYGWQRDGEPWQGVVGRSGLAWGDGLHGRGAPQGHAGPVKHEGDGAAPAGAFRIGDAFGFEPASQRRMLLDSTECVDDPKSASYNQIVERTGSADWTSSEHMRTIDQYALGAVIDHNPKRIPGDGSCIFLHIWDGPDSTTVGCTAMDQPNLEKLLGSLGPAPVFVLLPKAEYDALRKPWGLPAL